MLTPEDVVGCILQDCRAISSLSRTHRIWPWKSMQLYIRSGEDMESVKFYFLGNSFPELESISLENSTSEVHYFQL